MVLPGGPQGRCADRREGQGGGDRPRRPAPLPGTNRVVAVRPIWDQGTQAPGAGAAHNDTRDLT